MTDAAEIGPVEYLIVAFPGNKFRGEIAPALAELVKGGRIRIIDIAFASKDEDGNAATFELSELDADVREGLENLGATSAGLFNEDDLMAAAEELDANSSAALLVWENLWAKPLVDSIRAASGELYDYDRVPHDVVVAAREWALSNA